MRPPRWLVVALLAFSVVAPIAAAAWWVFAPQLTMNRFISFVSAAQYDDANRMLVNARFVHDGAYVSFETGDFRCAFPPDYWPRSVSESNVEYYSRSLPAWLSGRRQFGAKENVFLVTLKFDAGPRRVAFTELFPYQKDTNPVVYKAGGLYGFSWQVSSTDPLTIEGQYSFGDPDGGFAVLKINGQERDRWPLYLGNGNFKLVCLDHPAELINYRIEVVDQEGNVRNKVEKSIELAEGQP